MGKPKFLPVEQAFPLSASVEQQQLIATFSANKDYYLYKHRLYIEQAGEKREPYQLSQPGIEKEDEYFGQITAFYGRLEARFDLSGLAEGTVTLHHQGCAEAGLCYPPQTKTFELTADNVKALETTATTIAANNSIDSDAIQHSWFDGKSWWAIAGIFFALGLGLTFTPCVLPMVPILTSVVLGQGTESGKRGFLLSTTYVIGMALTYAAAGVLMGLLGAGANVQMWLQTPWVLIVFAVLFALLALSMFGLFELQLPAGIRNKLNNISSRQQGGKWAGVFIMGMLSALIVS
ncbi:MAG TPA: protein-disulfide reductase DsbD domain-containing protein, partial [Pseudomonadales bacterium]|nr:protein-disulfide reductase DsbD domain-containing protein [Pseudomonadales bacterium]